MFLIPLLFALAVATPAEAPKPAAAKIPVAFIGVDETTPMGEAALLVWNQTAEDVKKNGVETKVQQIVRVEDPKAKDGQPVAATGGTYAPAGVKQESWTGAIHRWEEGTLADYRVASLAPGTYAITVRCDTEMQATATTERFTLAPGKRYRMACKSRARQRIRIELTEL